MITGFLNLLIAVNGYRLTAELIHANMKKI